MNLRAMPLRMPFNPPSIPTPRTGADARDGLCHGRFGRHLQAKLACHVVDARRVQRHATGINRGQQGQHTLTLRQGWFVAKQQGFEPDQSLFHAIQHPTKAQ